jgi:DNA-3-methyladenine glycosylase
MPDGSILKLRITETEAYCGEDDTASHVRNGKTKRTEVLYLRGGKAYVYHCYMFWLLNLSCGKEGDPQCVLIRGVEGYSGPGRVSKAMDFRKELYGLDLIPENGLWLEDDGCVPEGIAAGPRIGIPYASEEDRLAYLNFRLT